MNRTIVDKVGVIGSVLAALAAAAPCCLPLLAAGGTSLGLGFLWPYQAELSWLFQLFSLMALLGVYFAYRRHHEIFPLIIAAVAFIAIVIYYQFYEQPALIYSGLAGLLMATYLNHRAAKRCRVCHP